MHGVVAFVTAHGVSGKPGLPVLFLTLCRSISSLIMSAAAEDRRQEEFRTA